MRRERIVIASHDGTEFHHLYEAHATDVFRFARYISAILFVVAACLCGWYYRFDRRTIGTGL